MHIERGLYHSYFAYLLNQVLLPLKLVVPQPLVSKLPFLTTNREIRCGVVLRMVRGKLLDVGCGTNELVREYRAAGGNGVGVDVYPWPNVDMIVDDTSVIPSPDHSFDTITFVACVNHIPNRSAVLREARRLLAPGGRIVVTNLTPGLSRIWHRWAFWDEDQHERGMKPGEVYGFTRDELIALFTGAGFRLIERWHFSWNLNSLYVFEAADSPADGNQAH